MCGGGGGGGFRKLNIFGGMKILWIFFLGVIKNWTGNVGVISMHLIVFS